MEPPRHTNSRRLPLVLCAGIAALVAAVYARSLGHGFVNFDDSAYVYDNPVVRRGLTLDGLVWAFAGFHVANWHPLTWISHLLDVEVFGLRPGAHHAVSVALHAAGSLALFALLRSATGAIWRSALAAALFAIHPLHVESVAWVSERKDVLSTLFLFLSLAAYVRWARSASRRAYLAALGLFALGLLAKPMVVTLPFLLLLMDVWPLGRLPLDGRRSFAARLGSLALEKAPFFALSAAACVVTFVAQSAGGGESAMSPIAAWPRIANAVASSGAYLVDTVWPAGLASFYPHPATIGTAVPLLPVAASAAFVSAVTLWVVVERVRRPYLLVGWLWYLGTLVPVIGLVQVGGQARADRYSYVPLVGIFLALAWGGAELAGRWRVRPAAAGAGVGVALAALSVVSFRQVGFWKDSVTLHERAIAVTARNWKAWHGLCGALVDEGRPADAIPACRAAIEALPTFPEAWQTLGVAEARLGRPAEAIPYLERALALRPDYFNALHNLGSVMGNLGDYAAAAERFRQALALKPDHAEVWGYLALALFRLGDGEGAREAYARLARLDPARAEALRSRFGLDELASPRGPPPP